VCNTWLDTNPSDHPLHNVVETIKELALVNEEKDETIKHRSLQIVLEKYTEFVDGTKSGFYWPSNSPHSDVHETPIGEELLKTIAKACMTEKFLEATYYPPRKKYCGHENETTFAVKCLAESVLEGLKLHKIIDVVLNRTLAGAECDILFVYKTNRLPFAAMEIKKPPYTPKGRAHLFHGDKERGGNRVSGEIWCEIHAVRLFGFDKVFGMISTSNQFRLVCTGEINDESDNEEAMLDSLAKLRKLNEIFKDEAEDEDESSKQIQTSPLKKQIEFADKPGVNRDEAKIYGSQIIPNLDDAEKPIVEVTKAGREIMQLMILFVLKACTTLTNFLNGDGVSKSITVYKKMPCRILSHEDNEFAFGTVTLTRLNLDVFNPELQNIHVIRHLGIGDSGNCCLGVSDKGGSSCAVKFYHFAESEKTKVLAEEEYQNWENIYGGKEREKYSPPMAYRLKLAEGYCLVMPYLTPIPESDRRKLLEKSNNEESMIEETLRNFAKSGYKHEDIKWRHFGYWGKKRKKIYLFDLGKVAKVKKSDIDSWVAGKVEMLRKKAGNPVTPGRKRNRNAFQTSSPSPKHPAKLTNMCV